MKIQKGRQRVLSVDVLVILFGTFCFSTAAVGEMYVCKRSNGSSVFRNMACSSQERTVTINGVSPQEWERRANEKYIADIRAREIEVAESARKAGEAAKTGGVADTVKNIAAAGALGLRAILDPMGR